MSIFKNFDKPTPKFFRIIRNVAATAVVVAGAILSLPAAGVTVPAGLLIASQYAVYIGGALGLGSQATVSKSERSVQ